MSTTPFSIPDTSPVFNYSPCEACGSSGTWQSAYQAQGDGYDATFHQSSGEDFVVTFNISGILLHSLVISTKLTGVRLQLWKLTSRPVRMVHHALRHIAWMEDSSLPDAKSISPHKDGTMWSSNHRLEPAPCSSTALPVVRP